MMKKYKAHHEKMKVYSQNEERKKRRLIQARRNAKAKNSPAAQSGRYNRPRNDDQEVLDKAYKMAKRRRDLSPSNVIPDTAKKRLRLPSIYAVSYVPESVLKLALP